MKTSLRKYLSLVMVLFVAFVCLFAVNVKAATVSTTYTFSNYTAGTQYAENEEHVLDDVLTLYTTQCHFTTQLRVYSSSSHDGYVVSNELPGKILSLGFNMGNKVDTLNVYGSTDGSTWTLVGGVATTSTSYLDYTLAFTNVEYTYFKLDVAGSNQIRIKTLTVEYETSSPNVTVTGTAYAEVNDGSQLTATLSNVSGTVVWASSDETVATVDQDGYVTAVAVGSATITATVDGTEGAVEFKVFPEEGSELTISDALAICELTGANNCPYTYTVTGVATITEAYNETYDNITVTITDGTNSIQVYRMAGGSTLVDGTKITVTGTLVNYNNATAQFNTGATYTVVEDSDDLATIKETLNNISAYFSMAYKYTTNVNEVEVAAQATITFDDTTKRTSFSTDQQVWEENGVKVTNDKDSSTNNIADYSDPVRFYKSSKVTISYGISFETVEFYCNTDAYATALVGATVDGATLAVDSEDSKKVVLTLEESVESISITMPAQVRVDSIVVNCANAGTTAEVTYTDQDFRIKVGVALALSDISNIDSYGIKVTSSNGTEKTYTVGDGYWSEDSQCYYVIIKLGDVLTYKERLDVTFTVQAYVVVDEITYESTSTKTHSVVSMTEEYYGLSETTNAVAGLYATLQDLGKISK